MSLFSIFKYKEICTYREGRTSDFARIRFAFPFVVITRFFIYFISPSVIDSQVILWVKLYSVDNEGLVVFIAIRC